MKKLRLTPEFKALLVAMVFSSTVGMVLSIGRYMVVGSSRYNFLTWNLFLAWVPLGLGWWLLKRIQQEKWSSWQNITLTIAWLLFLPNSFYMLSDLIHLQTGGSAYVLFDTALLSSFSFTAFALGVLSLLIMHWELIRRYNRIFAHSAIGSILALCSFAIYLGRDLRWNSWDILTNPAGLIFDISERIVNPSEHGQTYLITLVFFLLLSSVYVVVWQASQFLQGQKR